jgi:hypothetical protein
VSPTSCPAAGGTKVIITGTGFTGATSVTFGSTSPMPARFVVDSDTQITAITPDSRQIYSPGSDLMIIVTTPAGSSPNDATAPAVTFGGPTPPPPNPGPPPKSTAVSPTKCPAAGGTKVVITGTGFTGATSVTFGLTSPMPAHFVVDSDTQITATTPDSRQTYSPGSDLTIIVTTPAGSSPNDATAPAVTFGDAAPTPPPSPTPPSPSNLGPPPKPTAVSPTKCPAAGGTKVIITGTGFTGATSVTFGLTSPMPARFVVDSDTQITAVTPDSRQTYSPGSDLTISVTTPAGSSPNDATAPAVTFGGPAPPPPNPGPPPKATAVAPTKCPAAGGTKVIITGNGFTGATSVTFGLTSPMPARFVVDSDTQITAITPDSRQTYSPGSDLTIIVTTPAGSSPNDATAPAVTFGDPPPSRGAQG